MGRAAGLWRGNDDSGWRRRRHQGPPGAVRLYQWKTEYTRDERYPAKEYSGLEEIVKEFLGADKVTAACFGVPGPVRDGRLRLTNLPWTLDSRELSAGLGIQHVFLINDLEANGYGIAELSADQIYTLSEGDASQIGNRALIAAGTGLGEGFLVVERANPYSLSLRGRAHGLCAAQRRRDRVAALSASRSTTGASALSAWSAAWE